MHSAEEPRQNRVLAALPAQDYERLLPALEPVSMPLEWTIHESGNRVEHVYFPTTSVVSLLRPTQDGNAVGVAVVGNEGMVGVSSFMGDASACTRAIVQNAGAGFRLAAHSLQKEFRAGGALQRMALRYTQCLLTQIAQTAICYRYHSPDQQLCRWLLLSLDRISGTELAMPHERIAGMLGQYGETAGELQASGRIRYAHNRITVPDRRMLEQLGCECYGVIRRESNRLLQYH
jgi:hypothetical protein